MKQSAAVHAKSGTNNSAGTMLHEQLRRRAPTKRRRRSAIPLSSILAVAVLATAIHSATRDRGANSSASAFQASLPISRRAAWSSSSYYEGYHRFPTPAISTTRLFDSERMDADDLQLSAAQLNPNGDQQLMPSSVIVNATLNATLLKPTPTVNGGFLHTAESRAKISQANKGKTPWNKGKTRSEETRARIAAGVRKKNRERFLIKLEKMNMTEAEYDENKKQERRRKDQERRARRTENGGYRPTEETKKKISNILKEKWRKGEIKRRKADPANVRRGFKHSEETRAKISASLRKRWATDEEYRKTMVSKTTSINSSSDTRKKISATLKAKWKDPEFRESMLARIRNRTKTEGSQIRGAEHRRRISEAMKAKWKDAEYRNKTMTSIREHSAKLAALRPPKPPKAPRRKAQIKPKRAKIAKQPIVIDENGDPIVRQVKKVKRKVASKRRAAKKKSTISAAAKPKRAPRKKKAKKEPDGSINRLRDERRDLYDLLYGDDKPAQEEDELQPASGIAAMLNLEDENLDTFDPYGLEDF